MCKLTCEQVLSLMIFYSEDRLNKKLKQSIDEHLKNCTKCYNVYKQAKINLSQIYAVPEFTPPYITKQYEQFKNNLSAYIDNELDENASIRMKKIVISNPMARKDLEDSYEFKKLLQNSFDKIQNECRHDYSKNIVRQLSSEQRNTSNMLKKLILTFSITVTLIVTSFIITLYF